MKVILICLFAIITHLSIAQVKHNFEMDPENTDCDELPEDLSALPLDNAIAVIDDATYRFEQHISISRYHSPREATYYSCDGEMGWMIAIEKNEAQSLFADMPKSLWDAFIEAKDPVDFYQSAAVKELKLEY